MTEFQKYCKKNLDAVTHEAFDKFKEFYPDLNEKQARREFNQQLTDLFFNPVKRGN